MAARPLPPPEADRHGTKSTGSETHGKHRLVEIIRPSSTGVLQQTLYAALKRRGLRIAGGVVLVLLLLMIVLPLFINVNSFRPKIESEATSALGRQVRLGNLSLSIISGSIGLEDISIADDPAFSKTPFITAKSLRVGIELIPLIFSKQVNVTSIALNEPQITLLKASNGTWNFSSLSAASGNRVPRSQSSTLAGAENFSIGKLEIDNGTLSVGNANSTTKSQMYEKVNVEVNDLSSTSKFPFKLSAELPGGGNANVSGKAGPISPQDAAKTPLEASLTVQQLNLGTSAFTAGISGIGGLASFEGTVKSDGSQIKSAGQVTCDKLKLSPNGSPAPKSVTINYAADVGLDTQAGAISQSDIAIGKAIAHLTGGFRIQGQTQILNLRLHAPGMQVDELEAMLPALGIQLPSGSRLHGGTLSAELGITGPVDKLFITGPVRLTDTQLEGFDLGTKLGALSAFAGKAASSRDISIQNASLNARVAPEGTRADDINLTVPAIGVITGSGTVSPQGALDFKMVANLQSGVAGGLTKVAALGTKSGGIPFSIKGTTSNPTFVPDLGGVAEGVAQGALDNAISTKTGATKGATQAAGALGGLLGKKNPK